MLFSLWLLLEIRGREYDENLGSCFEINTGDSVSSQKITEPKLRSKFQSDPSTIPLTLSPVNESE